MERSVILHELVHLLIDNSSLGLASPPWCNEGVAEYFSTYQEAKDQIVLGDMSILGNRFYDMLKRGTGKFENIDTEKLFKTPQEDILTNEDSSAEYKRFLTKFYARSVAVVHYMNADPDRRKKLYQYLALLNKGYPIDQVFAEVFKMSYAELDNKVNKYISGKYLMARMFPYGKGGVEFPKVQYQVFDISKSEAMGFLYKRISMLPAIFIDAEDMEKLNNDLESLYSDFFQQK